MKLLYLANMRLPTEKAHGLQIMQNCEAFAGHDVDVSLWAARRFNTPELRAIGDVYAHYGVERIFHIWRVPCLDLPLFIPEHRIFRRTKFALQVVSYTLVLLVALLFTRADIYYTRDLFTVLTISLIKPRRRIAYEPHRLWKSAVGSRLQRLALRRAGTIIPVTPKLGETLIARGADADRVHIAHDGFRRARFDNLPDQVTARRAIGWDEDAFIVGYLGRLHTMSMDKGVGTLIEALRNVDGAAIALVGGPDDMAEKLRQQWRDDGLPDALFLYAGAVPPDDVPRYLSAFDVCAMPFPWTEHFAYHASPIKLFEYMACGRAIVASDLPAYADVVEHERDALLVPPGDVDALTQAIIRLRDDADLRQTLATNAHDRALAHYTWDARARSILDHIQGDR